MKSTVKRRPENILLISDIEGSSGCRNYEASSFMGRDWPEACLEMTLDVNAVVTALFDAGVKSVTIKDFHRTGYNLFSEKIHPRAQLVSGYHMGPVPGIGSPGNADAVIFLGMHAASGTPGFLPHTLTSRLSSVIVNGRPMSELELFSASLSPFNIRPIFFSGCPAACYQAVDAIPGIHTFPIDKYQTINQYEWRKGLAKAAAASLNNFITGPYCPDGPFTAFITMRDGRIAARKLALRWQFKHDGAKVFIDSPDIHTLYRKLIRLCYLTPVIEKILPWGLYAFNLKGRLGIEWARYRLRHPHVY